MAIASPREVSSNTEVKETQVNVTSAVSEIVKEDGDRIALLISAHNGSISYGWDKAALTAGTGHTMFTTDGIALDISMQQKGGLVCRALYGRTPGIAVAYVTEVRYIRR